MSSASGGRRAFQIVVGVLVSVLLLYLAVRGEDWHEIWAALAAANYWYIPAILAVTVYTLVVRAQRWRALLERAQAAPIPMRPVFSATAIGFMGNLVLPLRAGEVARPFLLTRLADVSVSVAFATAVLERVLDMIAVLVLLIVVAATSGFEGPVRTIATSACVGASLGLTAIFVIHRQKARLLPFIDRLWVLLPEAIGSKVIEIEHGFFDGLASIAQTSTLVRLVAQSVYLWLVIGMTFYLGALAIGINIGFIGGGVAVAGIVAMAVALPSAPGFVGVWQYGCKVALSLYGVPEVQAVAFAFFTHFMVLISQIPIGLVFLVREGLSFGELGRAAEKGEAVAPAGEA